MIRSTLLVLFLITALASGAGAQSLGIDPNSLRPGFRVPLKVDTAETYKRLPYLNLASEIRIESVSRRHMA